ncbi:MAG TPA: hypothetical protein VL860_12610, partial [Planctomycetota bacterium]|nr:hypothetical protein [Planctomycetota bacterium]
VDREALTILRVQDWRSRGVPVSLGWSSPAEVDREALTLLRMAEWHSQGVPVTAGDGTPQSIDRQAMQWMEMESWLPRTPSNSAAGSQNPSVAPWRTADDGSAEERRLFLLHILVARQRARRAAEKGLAP